MIDQSLYVIAQNAPNLGTKIDLSKTFWLLKCIQALTNKVYNDTVCSKHTEVHSIPIELVSHIQIQYSHLT